MKDQGLEVNLENAYGGKMTNGIKMRRKIDAN